MGYQVVRLRKEGKKNSTYFLVHRLVAEAFIPNVKNKPEVDHIDTNKTNNKAENLRWCWHLENMIGNKTTLSKLNDGYKKKVIYESIRQDLSYSQNLSVPVKYDNKVKQIVEEAIGKTTDELLETLEPSNYGNKTLNRYHSHTTNNNNTDEPELILFVTINDIHPGMKIKVGREIGKITCVDATTKKVKYVLSTGEKGSKFINEIKIG